MHAETAVMEQGEDTQSDIQAEVAEQAVARFYGSIMDVLMPATPPEPKNARIVRQFDLEAAKTDSRPVAEVVPARQRPERRSREEARAVRNRSLRAAAGLTD